MEEEAEDDALGYLTLLLPAPLWFFDLLVGVTPLLQVGLSDPGGKTQTHVFMLSVSGKTFFGAGFEAFSFHRNGMSWG